ncbi:beta-glucosidase [Reticulibacter mediterranei]|uniref:Beta-glucosidase n=1 Tax=Reticulibacter mediterranei TaxID=2778369 RepID=A0A8J3IK43_9CHLR|nr:glycoside hydrolase family 3 C-terminal domain-containing protein [Reticulibacter mediterranei]GHO93913.1 beta-glucosidase [Reticulibacter mediterranei]
MSDRIEDLLGQMTLQEKVSLLAGSDMWHTVAIERLGIPALKMSDGPNGARGGGSLVGGTKAACFPAGISLASTWNTDLVRRVGQALGQEARSKGAHVLLAPTVNIHRSPLNGRNFENYSEDPYLSARMAVAYINGVQSEGVGTSVKHYICNDSEFERNTINSEVDERTMREIYLPPFEAAIREARSWTIMASYNLVNGVAASENSYLLTEILRDEWGYDGLVVSDWFMSVKSTAPSVNAGLDLEMPGPGVWRGELLLQAVERGEVDEATLDTSIRRLLLLLQRAGVFEHPEEPAEQGIDLPEHRALIREAAAEGIVLLKNEGDVLPLQHEKLNSVAIIGPNAKVARIMAGGSAQVNAHYAITPHDGVAFKLGEQVEIGYELGCPNHKQLPQFEMDQLLAGVEGNEHGWRTDYFNGPALTGSPIYTEISKQPELMWFGSNINPNFDVHNFSMRATARFMPAVTGTYTFSLTSAGLSRFFINDELAVENWTQQMRGESYFGMGSTEVKTERDLVVGQEYILTLEYAKNQDGLIAAVRPGCLPPLPADGIERAVALAGRSDVALIFAGLSGEWESEGFDRPNIDLVGQQNELIERVAAANKRTIVVLNTGSPIAMPWLEQVEAVVQAWFPGQECGNAIADVLFGDVNPSGKLPQTFPVRLEDNPAYINYPGENGKVRYGEGLFVGYRYYEKKKIEPLFPFGFGLSYTTFDYDNLRLSTSSIGPEETLEVQIDITNTGERAGKEIVQVYVRDVQSRLHRPDKELKAFAKVQLEPGEHKTVSLSLARQALAYYDDLAQAWVAEAGEFEVLVGSSSQAIQGKASFTLTETSRFGGTLDKD